MVQVTYPVYLPAPEVLERYHFIKNGPERFMRMAERQQRHRHKLEERASRAEAFQRVAGTLGGIVIGVLGIGGGVYLLDHGYSLTGMAAFIGSLSLLVGAMHHARRAKRADERSAPRESALDAMQLPLPLAER